MRGRGLPATFCSILFIIRSFMFMMIYVSYAYRVTFSCACLTLTHVCASFL